MNPWHDVWGNLRQMFWPAVTLGYFQVAFIARMTRSSLLDVLVEDDIRTARAQGLRERMVGQHEHANQTEPGDPWGSM